MFSVVFRDMGFEMAELSILPGSWLPFCRHGVARRYMFHVLLPAEKVGESYLSSWSTHALAKLSLWLPPGMIPE